MKKLVLFFALIGLVSLTASAQTKTCTKAQKAACAKTCTKAQKAACAKSKAAMTKTVSSESMTAASRAASLDANIEEKVCATSGKVSFVKKSVCSASGKVSYADVKYCSESQAFVNVSPSKTAKAVKTGTATKKAACTKGKKACAKTCAKSKAAKAKLTKVEE